MKSQTINNIQFSTVSKLTSYTRTLLKKVGVCDSVKSVDLDAFNFLIDLIKNHPSYDERIIDFKDFAINYNHLNKKALELFIVNDNNELSSISWICCCSGNIRSDSELFNKCLRNIIKSQIYQFKNKHNTSICELCKKHSEKIHVDHYETTFKDIVKNFLIKYKLQIPTAFEKDEYNNVMLIGDDIVIGEMFEKYHEEVATYRILCVKCNLGRSKDGTDIEVYDVEEKKGNVFYMKEYVIDLD
jgi:hypothetical protein